ncbi:MAG: hypothetical protein IKR81_01495 [Victivallales bacterium]|nr:hypothetical protein [Victivallales bacterium]
MAHYTVEHTCGHTHTYSLFGPMKERDRKLAWLAEQDCPACRREADMAKTMEDTTPVTGEIIPMVTNAQTPGTLELTIALKGGTYRRKEELKASGAVYGEIPAEAGLFGFLGREKKGWYVNVSIQGAELKGLSLDGFLGLVKAKSGLLDIALELPGRESVDLNLLADRIVVTIREADALAELPPAPTCHNLQDLMGEIGAYWNGKFYGREGNEVYLDGKRYVVPAEIKAQYESEQNAFQAWKAQKKAAIEAAREAK